MRKQQSFTRIDPVAGWMTRPGRQGVSQLVLGGSIDVCAKAGRCTRLVKFEPRSKAPASKHDYWEETYLVSGDLSSLDRRGREIARSDAPAYVCRPPGEVHGPFASERGCLLLTIEYYVSEPKAED